MYKIFIDTNIFLDFYRINSKDNINLILKEIKKNKNYFINTEQSKDEFMRNRERTIKEFIDKLKSQNYSVFNNNFISTLSDYEKYENAIKNANNYTTIMINNCNKLKDNISEDPICQVFLELYDNENYFKRNDDIMKKAIYRKYAGNPPTSNKTTCCDEIIWETLLDNCCDDLVIVSKDETWFSSFHFLKNEYKKRTNKDLIVVQTLSEAIAINGVSSLELQNIENDIIVYDDIDKYGYLPENSNWTSIVYYAIFSLGGEASLKDIYKEAIDIVNKKYPEKIKNAAKEATIRGILQRYSDEAHSKYILFRKIEKGKWGIVSNLKSMTN